VTLWTDDSVFAIIYMYIEAALFPGGCGCGCRLGPALHLWHSEGRPSLTFFVSYINDEMKWWLGAVYSDRQGYQMCTVTKHIILS